MHHGQLLGPKHQAAGCIVAVFACALVATMDTESSGRTSGSMPGVADGTIIAEAPPASDTKANDPTLLAFSMTNKGCQQTPPHPRNVYERLMQCCLWL
jgi:hypothetical protein